MVRWGGDYTHQLPDSDALVDTEQYRSVLWQADANYQANDFAVSIETQGFEHGTWNDAQLASIKRLLLWLHNEHGIPLRECEGPFGSGVGYHTMWGAPSAWTPVAKSCPGPDRKVQFSNDIVPWMNGNPTDPRPPEDWIDMATKDDLIAAIHESLHTFKANDLDPERPKRNISLIQMIRESHYRSLGARRQSFFAEKRAARIERALRDLANSLPEDVAAKVIAGLDEPIDPEEPDPKA